MGRARLADGGVLATAGSTGSRTAARGEHGQAEGAHGRDSAPDRTLAAGGSRPGGVGERTVWLDCDVLQADGGTRWCFGLGAYVAANRALERFGLGRVLTDSVAAVSVGIVEGEKLLDLDYGETRAPRWT